MTPALAGAGLGLVAALGTCLAVAASPPLRRPKLDDRLAPYLRDAPRPSRLLVQARSVTPFPTLERLLGPLLRDAAGFVDRTLGGSSSVRRRLDQAGRGMTLEHFRIEQVLWGSGGLLGGLLLAVVSALRGGSTSPVGFPSFAALARRTGTACSPGSIASTRPAPRLSASNVKAPEPAQQSTM